MSKKELPPSKMSKAEEDWMTKKWRPMMAIMYMIACIFDFVMFPIMFTAVQFWETQAANDAFRQWAPITLQGGGLFHVAMGAVLGVSAWSRGQEKMAGVSGGPVATGASNALPQSPSAGMGRSTFGVSSTNYNPSPSSFDTPASTSYTSAPSWGTTPVQSAAVVTSSSGRPGPAQPAYPEI